MLEENNREALAISQKLFLPTVLWHCYMAQKTHSMSCPPTRE
ncbi:hypothetical protein RMAECT_1233 [Rickettsia rhipicephali str. Ect]|uniref:Uncharacterized protein n=1 Tax=Rickettsia rhipicephali str. Ect TaxID=1359199 RepID=A0A0F3PFD3_RICRH|nr:hypothetical protein RMAECT_1233 [Rickettsia rhipicephali str. Ect]